MALDWTPSKRLCYCLSRRLESLASRFRLIVQRRRTMWLIHFRTRSLFPKMNSVNSILCRFRGHPLPDESYPCRCRMRPRHHFRSPCLPCHRKRPHPTCHHLLRHLHPLMTFRLIHHPRSFRPPPSYSNYRCRNRSDSFRSLRPPLRCRHNFRLTSRSCRENSDCHRAIARCHCLSWGS